MHLTFSEVPPGTRALVLSMSQFGGSGFKNVKSLQARLVLEDEQQQLKEKADGEEGEEADEEAKPKKKTPKQPARSALLSASQRVTPSVAYALLLASEDEHTSRPL